MIVGVGVEPVLCSCGCGEATNAVVIEAQRLRDENGESWASASTKLGVSYAYIKTIRKNPAKSLRGHNRLPTSTERPCTICGKAFFSSLPPEKLNVCSSGFCTLERWKQRRVEWATNNAVMREVWRYRQLVKDAERVRRRALRLLRRAERDRDRRLLRQHPISLDLPLRTRDGAEFGSHESVLGNPWDDPVFDAVDVVSSVDPANLFAYARRATFIPEDFYQRCRDGELCLVVDDNGVRFLQRRGLRPWDVVPWAGNPVVGGFGGSRGRKSSRHRGRHAASAATRGRRSAKQSKTRV